jgi:hypothetical protein
MTAGAVLYTDCSVAAGANIRVKGFTNAYYKDEESVAEGIASEGIILKDIASEGIVLKGIVSEDVLYCKDKEDKQRRKEVITSLIKVKLRQLQKDTVIINLSLTSVSASLLFV